MRAARYFAAVDSHTEGMPTRVVTGGVGTIPGATMLERKLHFEAELDAAREVYQRLLPLARFDMTPKLVQYFKAAQDAVGFHGGPTRPPRLPLNDAERADLEDALLVLRTHAHA